jgi:hypothetical protein
MVEATGVKGVMVVMRYATLACSLVQKLARQQSSNWLIVRPSAAAQPHRPLTRTFPFSAARRRTFPSIGPTQKSVPRTATAALDVPRVALWTTLAELLGIPQPDLRAEQLLWRDNYNRRARRPAFATIAVRHA